MKHLKWKGLDVDPRKILESVTVRPNIRPESKGVLMESESEGGLRYLMPRIEAIHAGATRNNTRYLADKLRGSIELQSGVYSWMAPYAKPVIYNHDTSTRATGRVHSAFFSEVTAAGRPGITVTPKITDKQAIEDVLAGLLMTVSIGATTDSAVCSVCGTDILEEGFCGHYKGEEYEGVKTEWIAGNLWFDELSWVNVPADQNAMITDIGSVGIAEAFAGQGTNIIDLGKASTEWKLSSKAALAEGLITEANEKGANTLTIEELVAQAKQLEEEKTSLVTQLQEAQGKSADMEAKLTEATTKVEEKEAELAEKETALTEKTEALEAKTAELAEEVEKRTALEEAAEAVELDKVALLEEVDSLKAEKDLLVSKNAELVAESHVALVERILDLRHSLGKETNREEEKENLAKRTTASLKDSLDDLLQEFSALPVQRVVEKVDNPAHNSLKQNGMEPTTLKDGVVPKKVTAEDALMHLFGGPAFRTK